MSYNQRGNRVDPYTPLGIVNTDTNSGSGIGATLYQSPATYPQPWEPYHGDLGSPDYEMRDMGGDRSRSGSGFGGRDLRGEGIDARAGDGRPPMRSQPNSMGSMASEYSTASTLFPSQTRMNSEQESFLHDPLSKINTDLNAHQVPYKDHGNKQLASILRGMATRLAVTFLLCGAYGLAAQQYQKKGPKTEAQKKGFNTITTGISICLGLNIASAFKDIALNMRWVILNGRKRSLKEINMILSADSMLRVAQVARISKRPIVRLACLGWLFINVLAQAGIAMISLTYSWETDKSALLLRPGQVAVPRMDYFYPQAGNSPFDNPAIPSAQDEAYTAHMYGGLVNNYGFNESATSKKDGDILLPADNMVFGISNSSRWDFHFTNSQGGAAYSTTDFSVFTDRTISSTSVCVAHEVTANGNGSFTNITAGAAGPIFVSHKSPDSLTFFTNRPNGKTNFCGDGPGRCSVVEAFEASATQPWYYRCNITITPTINDPSNISFVPDRMAIIAGSSIAQVGYTDDGQEAQIYPRGSFWGTPRNGSADQIGEIISLYALGSIASAALYNPVKNETAIVPSQGTYLKVGHRKYLAVILGLISGCHLIFVLVVAGLANKAKIGPDNHLKMAIMLKPVAERLEGLSSNAKNEKPYEAAVTSTRARWERGVNGKWGLVVT